MNALTLLAVFSIYTIALFVIAWASSRKSDARTFYFGDRKSNWIVVSYGMIGASVSGVTFLSLPGNVLVDDCHYLPLVLSYMIGYLVIAFVLLPLYYRSNLTSIYLFLEHKTGPYGYKTGAFFFIVSRLLGVAIRTFVVTMVLHVFVLHRFGLPFWSVALIFTLLAIAYTYQGGIKTIIWTDTFQTTFVLLALFFTFFSILARMEWSVPEFFARAAESPYSSLFDWDWSSKSFVPKHVIAGILAPIVMTGLDQGMMQKNMSCKTLFESQKNVVVYSVLVVLFCIGCLVLGVALALFCRRAGITVGQGTEFHLQDADRVFPVVVFEHLGPVTGICFFIGLISAAYPACANALTAVTTSICVDLLELEKKAVPGVTGRNRVRKAVLCLVTILFLGIILLIDAWKSGAIVDVMFWAAAYTYGPLLGLFAFAIFSRRTVYDPCVPVVCFCSPLLCFLVEYCNLIGILYGTVFGETIDFSFGFALLLINGLLTCFGLFCCSRLGLIAK